MLVGSIFRYGALTCCVHFALRSICQEHSCVVNLGSTCNVWFMKLSGHFDVSTQSVLSTEANVTYAEQLYSGLACYAGTQQCECDVAWRNSLQLPSSVRTV